MRTRKKRLRKLAQELRRKSPVTIRRLCDVDESDWLAQQAGSPVSGPLRRWPLEHLRNEQAGAILGGVSELLHKFPGSGQSS